MLFWLPNLAKRDICQQKIEIAALMTNFPECYPWSISHQHPKWCNLMLQVLIFSKMGTPINWKMLNACSHCKIIIMDHQIMIFESLESLFHFVINEMHFFDVNIGFPDSCTKAFWENLRLKKIFFFLTGSQVVDVNVIIVRYFCSYPDNLFFKLNSHNAILFWEDPLPLFQVQFYGCNYTECKLNLAGKT